MTTETHQPLRVLLVAEPGWAGVFRHVEGLADYLHEHGHLVAFAYSDVRGSEGLQALISRVEDRGGLVTNLRVSHAPQPADLRAWFRLCSIWRKFHPTVVHAHSSKAGALVRLPFLFALPPVPLFYTPNEYYGMGRPPGFGNFLFSWIERLLANIGTTINISPDEARFGRDHLGLRPENQRLIHNPTRTHWFLPATPENRIRARQELSLPGNAWILGTSGRIDFTKDIQTLYQALPPIFARYPDLRLVHMVTGSLDLELENAAQSLHIRDRIHFLPYREDMRPVYQSLDGFVMTSRVEAGWPIVILEALSSNLPIVCSTGPGMSNIGHSGLSHCWTAPVGDVAGFQRALGAMIADSRHPRLCNHREIALQRFSPEKIYADVVAVYRERLASRT